MSEPTIFKPHDTCLHEVRALHPTTGECLMCLLESAEQTVEKMMNLPRLIVPTKPIDEIAISSGGQTYRISAFDSETVWIENDGEGMQVSFEMLDKFFRDTF